MIIGMTLLQAVCTPATAGAGAGAGASEAGGAAAARVGEPLALVSGAGAAGVCVGAVGVHAAPAPAAALAARPLLQQPAAAAAVAACLRIPCGRAGLSWSCCAVALHSASLEPQSKSKCTQPNRPRCRTDPVEPAPARMSAQLRAPQPAAPTARPTFRVVSYNLLADQYAGSTYAQEVCNKHCVMQCTWCVCVERALVAAGATVVIDHICQRTTCRTLSRACARTPAGPVQLLPHRVPGL